MREDLRMRVNLGNAGGVINGVEFRGVKFFLDLVGFVVPGLSGAKVPVILTGLTQNPKNPRPEP